jgi:hypothetical protein
MIKITRIATSDHRRAGDMEATLEIVCEIAAGRLAIGWGVAPPGAEDSCPTPGGWVMRGGGDRAGGVRPGGEAPGLATGVPVGFDVGLGGTKDEARNHGVTAEFKKSECM